MQSAVIAPNSNDLTLSEGNTSQQQPWNNREIPSVISGAPRSARAAPMSPIHYFHQRCQCIMHEPVATAGSARASSRQQNNPFDFPELGCAPWRLGGCGSVQWRGFSRCFQVGVDCGSPHKGLQQECTPLSSLKMLDLLWGIALGRS